MARPTSAATKREYHRAEAEIMLLFRDAGFNVFHGARLGKSYRLDLVASQDERGKPHVIGIEIKTAVTLRNIADVQYQARRVLDDDTTNVDEMWIIVSRDSTSIIAAKQLDRRIRILDLDMLRKALAKPKTSKNGPTGRARTKIGKAIEANETAITLAISGLILQIDDKLEGLHSDLRNDPDSIAIRDERISDFERIRAELENIRATVAAFTKGGAKEKEVVKSVTTFRDGVKNWWHKGHEAIITKTFDTGLLLSSVGILKVMNADLKTGTAIAGALIAGKSIAGGVKQLGKKVFGD